MGVERGKGKRVLFICEDKQRIGRSFLVYIIEMVRLYFVMAILAVLLAMAFPSINAQVPEPAPAPSPTNDGMFECLSLSHT